MHAPSNGILILNGFAIAKGRGFNLAGCYDESNFFNIVMLSTIHAGNAYNKSHNEGLWCLLPGVSLTRPWDVLIVTPLCNWCEFY